jgi:hypothetical protein
MKSMRNLWWLGVVAAVAACDPYDDERGGQPEILSVIASGGDSDGAAEFFDAALNEASGAYEVTATSTCTPAVPDDPATTEDDSEPEATIADASIIYVKMNKLLDGASIQATPESCAPANGWITATKNGAPDTENWFSCYSPATATDAEGSSIVLYRGLDVTTGSSGDGWFVQSDSASKSEVNTYTIQGTVQDKSGNPIPLSIAYTVDPDAGPVEPTVTAATGEITWAAAGCGTATAYNVYKQDEADAEPVLLTLTPIPARGGADLDFTDPGPIVPGRVYFIAPLVGTVETKLQGPFPEE